MFIVQEFLIYCYRDFEMHHNNKQPTTSVSLAMGIVYLLQQESELHMRILKFLMRLANLQPNLKKEKDDKKKM